MTNIVAQISIALCLSTNWTGVTFEGKELGYVVTNHVATVAYQGSTNQFTLKTDASNWATWRTNQSDITFYLDDPFEWHPHTTVITNIILN